MKLASAVYAEGETTKGLRVWTVLCTSDVFALPTLMPFHLMNRVSLQFVIQVVMPIAFRDCELSLVHVAFLVFLFFVSLGRET